MSSNAVMHRVSTGADALGRWCTLTMGVSIPVSVALDNVLLAAVLLAWLVGAQYRVKLMLAWTNPVYRAAVLLYVVLLAGATYGHADSGDTQLYLGKYLDLALVPVLGWMFLSVNDRVRALQIFGGGLALVLLTSCALKIGLIPPNPWLHGTAGTPVVFKLRLTHNILMAFAAFLFAWLALTTSARKARIAWAIAAVLAIANVTLMVDGITGFLVLATLTLLIGWQRRGWHGVVMMGIISGGLIALLLVIPGPIQARVQGIVQDFHSERADRPASTSPGLRLEYYRNTLAMIKEHPVFGTGTGGFPAGYANQIKGSGSMPIKNPHNEFLLLTAQTGIIGLAALLWLLWQQWRLAPRLPTPLEQGLAQGLVITIFIVCMLNSPLLDHTEGLLYAWLTALLYAGLKSGD